MAATLSLVQLGPKALPRFGQRLHRLPDGVVLPPLRPAASRSRARQGGAPPCPRLCPADAVWPGPRRRARRHGPARASPVILWWNWAGVRRGRAGSRRWGQVWRGRGPALVQVLRWGGEGRVASGIRGEPLRLNGAADLSVDRRWVGWTGFQPHVRMGFGPSSGAGRCRAPGTRGRGGGRIAGA